MMRKKILYFLFFAGLIFAVAAGIYLYQNSYNSEQVFAPIPDSIEIERDYEFKIPPPKTRHPVENPKAIMDELAESAVQLFENSDTHIVAIGDSLTQGVGDETGQGGYVGILDQLINEQEHIINIDNFGKRGNRSDQLLNRLKEKEISNAVEDADIILITIGANDIMQVAKENIMNLELSDFVEERANYEKRLDQIFDHIQSQNSKAKIYLIGFYNPFEKYFPNIKELGMIVDDYNHTAVDIAKKEENISYIPTIDLFRDAKIELLAEDNFHPNYHGYEQIAGRVLEYIILLREESDDQS